MRPISSPEDLDRFKDERSVFSVFLTDGYDAEQIENILDIREAFDAQVKDHWHLLLPIKDGKDGGLIESIPRSWWERNWDHNLARRLISNLDIEESDLPVLVFPDHRPDGGHFKIHLNGLDEKQVRDIIRKIGAEIIKVRDDDRMSVDDHRYQVINQIRGLVAKKKIKYKVAKGLPVTAGLIGLIADFFSLGLFTAFR